jgi:hypothetical protein
MSGYATKRERLRTLRSTTDGPCPDLEASRLLSDQAARTRGERTHEDARHNRADNARAIPVRTGDGPVYTGTVRVIGPDEYGLDDDGDGVGCEAS